MGVEYNEIVRESELLNETDELLPIEGHQAHYLSTRISEKSYYKKSTSDYIFPGAEILVDEDDCEDLLAENDIEMEMEKEKQKESEKDIECDEPPQKKIKLDE